MVNDISMTNDNIGVRLNRDDGENLIECCIYQDHARMHELAGMRLYRIPPEGLFF